MHAPERESSKLVLGGLSSDTSGNLLTETFTTQSLLEHLLLKIETWTAQIGVIGLRQFC